VIAVAEGFEPCRQKKNEKEKEKSSLVIAVAEGFVAPDFAAAEVPVFVRRK
jgi:hypothetical protein